MFPTFRRIEGGYSYLNHNVPKTNILEDRQLKDPLEYGLRALSQRLGVYSHRFVTSISTSDVKQLLMQAYAEASSKTNENHTRMAHHIAALVAKYKTDRRKKKEGAYIEKIAELVHRNAEAQQAQLAAFTVVSGIIAEFFRSKAVKITEAITFGSGETVLDSDVLSAGEKQFLGFLAYNAMLCGGCIFIDEPELSLHTDWQRKLLPALVDQNPGNQLIVATHSPFIYSMYEDKELVFGAKP